MKQNEPQYQFYSGVIYDPNREQTESQHVSTYPETEETYRTVYNRLIGEKKEEEESQYYYFNGKFYRRINRKLPKEYTEPIAEQTEQTEQPQKYYQIEGKLYKKKDDSAVEDENTVYFLNGKYYRRSQQNEE